MNIESADEQVKSKKRVTDHGEVFINKREVISITLPQDLCNTQKYKLALLTLCIATYKKRTTTLSANSCLKIKLFQNTLPLQFRRPNQFWAHICGALHSIS